MPLIYCGIDEAGYGPLLGPLCVGCTVFRVESWSPSDPAPDLWRALARAVCRKTEDRRKRIAVEDSKKVKLANSSVRRHPLYHLERGVLAFMGCVKCEEALSESLPASDLGFFEAVGVGPVAESWYLGEPGAFPVAMTGPEIAIAANTLRLAMSAAGVSVLSIRAQAVSETAFNDLMEAAGTKAAVTEAVLVQYLGEIWDRFAPAARDDADGLRVVCDRQGGRVQYAGLLRRAFPEAEVAVLSETADQSRYQIAATVGGEPRRMGVAFKVEAESAHLPVALASMLAKLTRETYMARFNRYWCSRLPELKPTAGYSQDARRWLRDVAAVLSADERRALVRRA